MQLGDFKLVMQFINHDALILVDINDLVDSHLDYCNLFFSNLSKFSLSRLQCIQKVGLEM